MKAVAVFVAFLCTVSAAPSLSNNDFPVESFAQYFNDENNSSFILDQYVCIVNVFEAVSKEAGLESLWSEYSHSFADNIDKWQQCKYIDGKFAKLFCNLNNGISAYNLIQQFASAALEKDPVFYARFGQQYYKTCVKSNPFADVLLKRTGDGNLYYGHLKCIVEAIHEAVDKTPYQQLWSQYEKVLKEKVQNIVKCKDKQTPDEIKKCILAEVSAFSDVIKEFYDKLGAINKQLLEKIRKNIKDRCYKPSSIFNVL